MYGSCVSFTKDCTNAYWTSLILSTMTQSQGTSSGYLINPETTEPLLGTAMEETLQILANQTLVGPPQVDKSNKKLFSSEP